MTSILLIALLSGPTTAPAGTFHNCGLHGAAKPIRVRELNVLKNRSVQPWRVNPDITAEALSAGRMFPTDDGAVIKLFITNVKPGGIESVNCGATSDRDTHIEGNAYGPSYKGEPIIVEVTPRWREAATAAGLDWSTAALRKALIGKWVEFTGWVFIDSEHNQNAVASNPKGTNLWRQTVVELHPVTGITVQ